MDSLRGDHRFLKLCVEPLLGLRRRGPVDRQVRARLASAPAGRFEGDRRSLIIGIVDEEPAWKDRERYRRARMALYRPKLRGAVHGVVEMKLLELVDGIAAMTWHERGAVRRADFRRPAAWD